MPLQHTSSTYARETVHNALLMCRLWHRGMCLRSVSHDVVNRHAHTSPNGLIIHYTSNNQLIADGEMVLIDAGCEYKCVQLLCILVRVLTFVP